MRRKRNITNDYISLGGKIMTVIVIPLFVYYFVSKPKEQKKNQVQKEAVQKWKNQKDIPSEAEKLRKNAMEAITDGYKSILVKDSL